MDEPTDDQYKRATKAVDDAMRWDVLGPKVVEVLINYAPAKEHVEAVMLKAMKKDGDIKKEVNVLIDEHAISEKGKGLSQVQAIALTALITAVVTGLVAAIFIYIGLPQQK
jgi:hypothetical protein